MTATTSVVGARGSGGRLGSQTRRFGIPDSPSSPGSGGFSSRRQVHQQVGRASCAGNVVWRAFSSRSGRRGRGGDESPRSSCRVGSRGDSSSRRRKPPSRRSPLAGRSKVPDQRHSGGQPVSIVVRFPTSNMTKDQYESVHDALEKSGNWPAPGLVLHVCFGGEHDLRVSEIWDRGSSWRRSAKSFGRNLKQRGSSSRASLKSSRPSTSSRSRPAESRRRLTRRTTSTSRPGLLLDVFRPRCEKIDGAPLECRMSRTSRPHARSDDAGADGAPLLPYTRER